MTRMRWWIVLGLMSVGVVLLDIVTGPYILFPILFVIPVGLGALYLGRAAGIGFAIALVGCRVVSAIVLDAEGIPVWARAANAGIWLLVLMGLALLIAKVVQPRRALEDRVRVLEGILPICAFCQKIRRRDGVWERIETYVSNHSAVEFSHSVCEACAREHYGDYFDSPDSKDAEP
jgi:hypothetical protein